MRMFVAIELPEAARNAVHALGLRLRREKDGASWVRPENMHLTLRFYGDGMTHLVIVSDGHQGDRVALCPPESVLDLGCRYKIGWLRSKSHTIAEIWRKQTIGC